MKQQACLACGYVVDDCSEVTMEGMKDARPKPGDVSLCMRCGCLMMWTGKLGFRWPTGEEMAILMADERIQVALVAIEELNRPKTTRQ